MSAQRENITRSGAAAIAATLSLLCLGLWLATAPPAQAAFEGVGCFASSEAGAEPPATSLAACAPVKEEKFGEEVQLGGVGGMAVNYTGAGGVPKGTVYAMTETLSQPPGVVMFTPQAGRMKFEEAWQVTGQEKLPYERCGPLLGTTCSTRVEALARPVDVDVDQASGVVYAYYGPNEAGRKAIVAYSADGSEEIGRFGEIAPGGQTIAESPAKIHESRLQGGIAVGKAGEVFIYDKDNANHHRLMGFKPKGGGVYEYAAGEDVGSAGAHLPSMPVADAAGNLYVVSNSTFVEEYDPSNPTAPPLCSYEHKQGGIKAITVNPLTGNVFFYSFRIAPGFKGKTVHELGPCNEATGKFEGPDGEAEVGQFEVAPERSELTGLAFDPERVFEVGRPAGTLYGGAPNPVPPLGLGTGEPGQASLGYIFAPVKQSPPTVSGEAVSGVRSSSARLRAVVDPKAFATNYVFQYMTEAEYQEAGEEFTGAKKAPVGGGNLPGGSGAQAVGVTLSGLSPETTYRFRMVATNHGCPSEPAEELCTDEGEVRQLRTYPASAAGLPDQRAYELVSPADKHGGQVLPANPHINSCGSEVECKPGTFTVRFPMQSAPSGDAVAYEGTAFNPSVAAASSYIARRDPVAGWQNVNPSPAVLPSKGDAGYKSFSEDLGEAVLSQGAGLSTLSPLAPVGLENLYAQPSASPFSANPLLVAEPPHRSVGEFRIRYAGASADLSHVFFAANDALTGPTEFAPEAIDGGASKFNLYEWERASGQLRLVNVFPAETTEPGAFFGSGSAHAISADGSRAFFSDEANHVFVREDAEKTREIPGSGTTAKFLAAATDGSRVLLSDGTLYDLEEEASIDLTEDQGHVHQGGFVGLLGQSDGLTHLYFVDSKVLTGVEESCREPVMAGEEICETAQDTKSNLYEWNGGTTRFVATLTTGDGGGVGSSRKLANDWAPSPSERTAQASPGGRYLAFLSQVPLTGYDNTGPCETDHAGGFVPAPCPEVFIYDSETGELSCPSCNPSGAGPLGWSLLPLIQGGEWIPQARYLTDGGRLYFDTQDSLSPLDTNEGVEDVYEFEPAGGGCARAQGCVSLISAGTGSVDSNFVAADPSGANVFFTSRDRLVAADTDELIDLYDAREFGGFAFESQLPPGPCSGEGCQMPPPAPAEAPPASSSFEGPGNVKAPKCKKGQVKKNGKCVKKKTGKQKHKKSKRRGSR